MKCKHCGKELIAATLYIEVTGTVNTAPYAAQQPTWYPISAERLVYPSAVPCSHEPAIEPINTTGATDTM